MAYHSLFSFFPFLFGLRHRFCPLCFKTVVFKKQSSPCPSCHQVLPPEFFNVPIRLILIRGNMDTTSYETTLQRALLQGNLKDQGIDFFPLPPPYERIYALCSLKKGRWKTLSHICFCEKEILLSNASAILYFLNSNTEQNTSLHLENLIMEVSKTYTGIRRFFRSPLFILNLMPFEDILLNVPTFFSKIIETSHLPSSSFFSGYVRSTLALWYGRRLLEILEEVFPSIFYTSFSLSSHTLTSSNLKLLPFFWLLKKWGLLKSPKNTSLLSLIFLEKWSSFKKPNPKITVSKISPILEFSPPKKETFDAR